MPFDYLSTFSIFLGFLFDILLIAFPFCSFQIDLILQVWNLSDIYYTFSLTLTLSRELAILVMIINITIIPIIVQTLTMPISLVIVMLITLIALIIIKLIMLIILKIILLTILIPTHLLTTWNSCLQCLWLATASSSQCRRPLAP